MGHVVETVKFGGASVRCVERNDGRWHLRWRVGGREKTTTAKTREAALKRAREIAKDLSRSTGGTQVVSQDQAAVLGQLCGLAAREGLSPAAWLGRAEAAIAQAGGAWSAVERAVRHWEASGIGRIERRSMVEAIERFVGIYERDRARHTLLGIRKEVEAWVAAGYGAMGCWEVSRELIEAFIDRGDPAPSPRFRNNRLATWKTFWNRCRDWGYWPSGEPTPAEGIEKKREADRAPEILSPDQAWRGLTLLRERAPDLVWYWTLGCWAGLRPMELSRLCWEDLDWERGHILVRPEVAGKTLRERFVPMESPVLSLREVSRPKRVSGASGRVCGYKDVPRIAAIFREAGIFGPEGWPQDVMRHSYISYRIGRGDSLARIAEGAGNSEGVIRRRYRRPVMGSESGAWWMGDRSDRVDLTDRADL